MHRGSRVISHRLTVSFDDAFCNLTLEIVTPKCWWKFNFCKFSFVITNVGKNNNGREKIKKYKAESEEYERKILAINGRLGEWGN